MPLDCKILNLGCGADVQPDSVNLDCAAGPGVDVVFDLDKGRWPFPDDSFEQVVAIDVLEHLNDPLHFMQEAHRVLKHGYEMTIRVPHADSDNFKTDPTHTRAYNERSFEYFDPSTDLGTRYGHFYRNEKNWKLISVLRDFITSNITVVMRPMKHAELAEEWTS